MAGEDYVDDPGRAAEPLTPVVLSGRHVRLEPMRADHLPALLAAHDPPDLTRWFPEPLDGVDAMRRWIDVALAAQARGTQLPFVQIEPASGTVVGATRLGNARLKNRRIELGWTWIAPARQRGPVNSEAKRLLLAHAFDRLGMIRVELKCDRLNEASRRAIRALGAKEEGVLRHHIICADGRLRDSVYFSVVATDWPTVRTHLDARIARLTAAP